MDQKHERLPGHFGGKFVIGRGDRWGLQSVQFYKS